MTCRVLRGSDVQARLGYRTFLYIWCQMGKKAGEGVEDPPAVAIGCRRVRMAARQLWETDHVMMPRAVALEQQPQPRSCSSTGNQSRREEQQSTGAAGSSHTSLILGMPAVENHWPEVKPGLMSKHS